MGQENSRLCNNCLAGVVVLYLDGSCADHWKSWWEPCHPHHEQIFDVTIPMGELYIRTEVGILGHKSFCAPLTMVPAACARSIALKLQDVVLGKLVAVAFSVPAGRLMTKRTYETTDDLAVKLALLLELGLLWAGVLPLVVPLLCAGVLSERVLATLSQKD